MADEVEGLDELLENFMRLIEVAMGEPVTRAALAGGDVLLGAMLANAPGPHIVNQLVKIEPNFAQVGIGPDKEHWYYRLIETGVQAHVISPSAKKAIAGSSMNHPVLIADHPGVPARPFMRPAYDGSKDAALNAVGAEFWKDIQEAIR